MTNTDLSAYKGLYIQTAREYITKIQKSLDVLAQNKTDKEAIETVFIGVHSIKGQSQIMGYTQTGSLCSLVETSYRTIKDGSKELTDPIIDGTRKATEWMTKSVDAIEKENQEIDLGAVIEELRPSLV